MVGSMVVRGFWPYTIPLLSSQSSFCRNLLPVITHTLDKGYLFQIGEMLMILLSCKIN